MAPPVKLFEYPPDQHRKEISEDLKIQLDKFFKYHSDQTRNELIEEVKILLQEFLKNFKPVPPTVLMTRLEVADFLRVDISSVHNYTKRGILKSYGNQGRVYYVRSEVEEILKPLNV